MSTQTILVIDDDETTQELVEAVLEKHGFDYIRAMDGPEGLEKLSENEIDGILLDRIMPEMDGNEVLEKIKDDDKTSEIPVIMLTGENMISDVSISLQLGARDYIVKPFSHENLIVRLKNALNG